MERALRLSREVIEGVLAFAAGSGTYLAAVTTSPLRWQDWAGAGAAGALSVLLRMYPTRPSSVPTREERVRPLEEAREQRRLETERG